MDRLTTILAAATKAGIMSEEESITIAAAVMFTNDVTETRERLRFEFREDYGRIPDEKIRNLLTIY